MRRLLSWARRASRGRHDAEVRAAELRKVADLITANATCQCPVCRSRRDTAAMIRARADRIAPTTEEPTP